MSDDSTVELISELARGAPDATVHLASAVNELRGAGAVVKAIRDAQAEATATYDAPGVDAAVKAIRDAQAEAKAMHDALGVDAAVKATRDAIHDAQADVKALYDAIGADAASAFQKIERFSALQGHNEIGSAFERLKAMSKPNIDRLVKQATREAASTFQQVQKFSAEIPEITAAFTTLKLALPNASPSLSQSMLLAEEVFSQVGHEDIFSQLGHKDMHAELAPVDGNAMTERQWPAEWYTFGRFIERILEALHTQDGQLHPTTYPVAGVLVVTFLSGSWRAVAVLAIVSLWLRDVHTRAMKDDTNES